MSFLIFIGRKLFLSHMLFQHVADRINIETVVPEAAKRDWEKTFNKNNIEE